MGRLVRLCNFKRWADDICFCSRFISRYEYTLDERLRIWDPSSAARVAWRLSHVPDSIRYWGRKQLQRTWYRDDDSNSFTRHSQVKAVSGHRADRPAAKCQVRHDALFSVSAVED